MISRTGWATSSSGSVLNIKEDEVQRELISAGFYRISARKFIGYRALLAIAIPIVLVWLFALAGTQPAFIVLVAIVGFIGGWVGPSFVVHRLARQRLQHIDESLPLMIDLLVVTLEAGLRSRRPSGLPRNGSRSHSGTSSG